MKVGSQLPLNVDSNSIIEIRCGDIGLFSGKMGRRGDSVAIRITDRNTNNGKVDGLNCRNLSYYTPMRGYRIWIYFEP